MDDSRLNDEAIAKQLQLDEDAEVLPFHLIIINNLRLWLGTYLQIVKMFQFFFPLNRALLSVCLSSQDRARTHCVG